MYGEWKKEKGRVSEMKIEYWGKINGGNDVMKYVMYAIVGNMEVGD